MVSKMVTITNVTGLHARPATELVNFVKKFDCKVFLQNGSRKANAASIINVLTLGAKQGTELELICDGEDEENALVQVAELIATMKD